MSRIKKYDELSDDIKAEFLEIDVEKIKNGEYEIESIIDIITDPKDLPKTVSESGGVMGIGMDINKAIKRGDTIYIVAMIRKSGSSSFSSPASQSVLKVRIIDIYNGLSYLNKVINP